MRSLTQSLAQESTGKNLTKTSLTGKSEKTRFEERLLITLILLFAFIVINIQTMIAPDNNFDIPVGNYIIENGLPERDPFSLHHFKIMQLHWLHSVVIAMADGIFGNAFPSIFTAFYTVLFSLLGYFLLKEVTKNDTITIMGTCVMSSWLLTRTSCLRPQTLTLAIVMLELWLIEKYLNDNCRLIFLLPLTGILLANYHSAFIIILPIMILPAAAELVIKKNWKKAALLFIIAILSFGAGILNPYGLDGLLYFQKSGAAISQYISNETVDDLQRMNMYNAPDMFIFFFLILFSSQIKTRKVELRYIFLLIGTTIMALSFARNFSFFIIAAVIFASAKVEGFSKDVSITIKRMFFAALVIIPVCIICLSNTRDNFNKELNDALLMDETDYAAEHLKEKSRIFNALNTGPQLIRHGFLPYIDTRLESYGIEFNGESDIIQESFDFNSGKISFDELDDKYHFDAIIYDKNNTFIERELKNLKGWEVLFETENGFVMGREGKMYATENGSN